MNRVLKMLPVLAFAWASGPVVAAELPARLAWSQRTALSLPVSGTVAQVRVQVGSRVRKGEVLLALDTTAFRAQVAEARASVALAEAEEKDAKRNLDRIEELYDRTVIAATELEQAQLRHARAASQLAAARARLAAAQKQLDDAVLKAPFDAWVVARQVEPGQTVAAGLQPPVLLVVARAGEMLALAHAPLETIGGMRPGQEVKVAVGDKTYSGRVRTLGLEPQGDRGYGVEVSFPVSELLRAGTPATVRF